MSREVQIKSVYDGRDGDATKRLYAELEQLGPAGVIAVNLLRASKTSEAAKRYRGGDKYGSYRSQAYSRKQWSMENLARELVTHSESLSISWGWGRDLQQEFHQWVLYVDLPTGQVSFHTAARGVGPDYPGQWDGVRGTGAIRIIRWASSLSELMPAIATAVMSDGTEETDA